ncbi:MAG: glycosyltransferase [Syntrophomonadaceae bacterium]|jgi:glycosyltransferase involved in cell wall biosynthesis
MSNISCILYPPTLDIDYLVQRPQQLMKSFAELGITAIYMNKPTPFKKLNRGIKQINPNFYLFDNVDPRLYLKNVRPVVFYSAAAQVDLIKQYRPSLVVFDSLDEPSDEFAAWRPFYNKAIVTADVVLATSDKLFHTARNLNPHTYLIPNGSDYEYFSQGSRRDLPIPADMDGIRKPIIGYIGVVATWCDLELIDKIARNFPECNLVMIGPLYNVSKVPRRPNIHWLGFKPYDQLVFYAQMFDVGIIPFLVSSMTESVNPIKMWEYLAVGMPIVSTAIPETLKYGDLVYYSRNHHEFLHNMALALEDNSQEKRIQRNALARENSWKARAEQILQIIATRLGVEEFAPINPSFLSDIYSYETQELNHLRIPYTWSLSPFSQLTISGREPFRWSARYNSINTESNDQLPYGRKINARKAR